MTRTQGCMEFEGVNGEASPLLLAVAGMCRALESAGLDVSVRVELRGGGECSTSGSGFTPISVAMVSPERAAPSTSNGVVSMPQPADGASLPAAKGSGGNALPASMNGNGAARTAAAEPRAYSQGEMRKMSTEEMTEIVLAEIRRMAIDGVAPSMDRFRQLSRAPFQGLMRRRGCSWSDLVAEAGCVMADKRPKGGKRAADGAARFRDDGQGDDSHAGAVAGA